jgi:hypothetical protein
VSISPTRGTLNISVNYTVTGFPHNAPVTITWRRLSGTTIAIATVNTNGAGAVIGTFKVPATTGGPNQQITFKSGSVARTWLFEVVPRIKSNTNPALRGQFADISLRGYAKNETVRIRWKKGTSWVTLATVVTSNTGSANVPVKVPTWAPDGLNSVRGDGTVFRQQTNAVNVQGGPYVPASALSPTPTATPTSTPTFMPTAPPTATFVPTETPAPEGTPTSPVKTPTPEPSAVATATAAAPDVDSTSEALPTAAPEPVKTQEEDTGVATPPG